MEKDKAIAKSDKRKKNLKAGAKMALVVLLFNSVGQLVAVYQTRYQLASPLIPESTIWDINKQFIFHAIVSAIISIAGLLLYFFDKYLLVIILIAFTLLADRFIYL